MSSYVDRDGALPRDERLAQEPPPEFPQRSRPLAHVARAGRLARALVALVWSARGGRRGVVGRIHTATMRATERRGQCP